MNSVIRKLEAIEIPALVEIAVNAYPGTMQNTPDFKERISTNLTTLQENEKSIEFYGLFRNGKLVGGMRLHYFQMNLYSKVVNIGGVGLVAVDLLHKKEKVAKELITYFIQHFVNREVPMVALYPFRPDFYKNMGFGFGTKINQYFIEPSSFPKRGNKEGLIFLNNSHKELIKDCYNRYAKLTHGMMFKTDYDVEVMFKNPDNKCVGYIREDILEGYMLFSFKRMSESNFVNNNMLIKELIYENPLALSKLSTFLNSQNDQFNRIELNTQDDSIEYLIADPRNGSNHLIPSVYHETNTAGIGLMYRIINIERFIENLSEYEFYNQTVILGLNIMDSFMEEGTRRVVIEFKNGKASISRSQIANVEMEIEISDLSSLLMGATNVCKLYDFGKIKISNEESLSLINRLFSFPKPLCTTAF